MPYGSIVTAGGATLFAIIGSFLPWLTIGVFSKKGVDGDGAIALGLALAALGALIVPVLRGAPSRGLCVLAALLLLGVVVTSGVYIGDPALGLEADVRRALGSEIRAGSGLWITFIGGLVGVGAAVTAAGKSNAAAQRSAAKLHAARTRAEPPPQDSDGVVRRRWADLSDPEKSADDLHAVRTRAQPPPRGSVVRRRWADLSEYNKYREDE